MEKQVLVVGAGLTGATLSHYLSRSAISSRLHLTFWEKTLSPGGRFSTVRPQQAGLAILDDGAQYITRGAGRDPDAELYGDLLANGIIQPYTGAVAGARDTHATQEHYVCRDGMSAVARHLLGGASVEYGRGAAEFGIEDGRWRVCDDEGRSASFDAVVLTLPTPQLLELRGAPLLQRLSPHREALARAASRYSTRFAACAWFDEAAWSELRALPWASKYVRSGEAGTESLVYLSVEPRKREADEAHVGPAVLLHTSVPFGIAHADDAPDDVLEIMLRDLSKVVPGLPTPVKTHIRQWKYSQVPPPETAMKGETGVIPAGMDGAMALSGESGEAPCIVAGDAFVGSNFDNVAWSGRVACDKLLTALGES
jgi:renalase